MKPDVGNTRDIMHKRMQISSQTDNHEAAYSPVKYYGQVILLNVMQGTNVYSKDSSSSTRSKLKLPQEAATAHYQH